MAKLHVGVHEIFVKKHPNADSLELANIGSKDGYQVVVQKGRFKAGELVAYIPEGVIVPDVILEELGLTGALSGKNKNVVKAIRLRGEVSQGLVWQLKRTDGRIDRKRMAELHETSQDISQEFGFEKYVAPVPVSMASTQQPAPDLMKWVEIENLKKYKKVFEPGEPVVVTEKIHGTCAIFQLDVATGELFVSSKGIAANGLSLLRNPRIRAEAYTPQDTKHIKRAAFYGKLFLRSLAKKHLALIRPRKVTQIEQNLYWRVADAYYIRTVLEDVAEDFYGCTQVAVYGEIYGAGVQDLHYGADSRSEVPGFAAFDLRIGYGTRDDWLSTEGLRGELPLANKLYEGPYDRELIEGLAVGKETVTGQELHIREGVVVRPQVERYSQTLGGRAIGKFVSDDYLLRGKNDKGEEPTELQ